MGQPGPVKRLAVAGATGLIGSQLVRIASVAGWEVVSLSRSTGVDLTDPDAIGDRLNGVDAVVDVTRSPSMVEQEAVDFFTTVAANLGAAARSAGVRRTVVLSIVGIEESQDFGWYVATLAHERATREHAPGTRVLRATQFHEFPGQVLERARHGDRAEIMAMPTQPVASAEVAQLLFAMATGLEQGDVELAGPRQENLVDLVRRLVALRGDVVAVEPVPAPTSISGGPCCLVPTQSSEAWTGTPGLARGSCRESAGSPRSCPSPRTP